MATKQYEPLLISQLVFPFINPFLLFSEFAHTFFHCMNEQNTDSCSKEQPLKMYSGGCKIHILANVLLVVVLSAYQQASLLKCIHWHIYCVVNIAKDKVRILCAVAGIWQLLISWKWGVQKGKFMVPNVYNVIRMVH